MLTTPHLVPVLTSQAGLCLTLKNWQQTGITTAAFYLDDLLIKPGLRFLQSLPDLAAYFPWTGKRVLNASRFQEGKGGLYRLQSPFDGETITLDAATIIGLIMGLKPDYVVLSESLARTQPLWPQPIQPLVEPDYYHLRDPENMTNAVQETKARWIESDAPAHEAMHGRVYGDKQRMTIVSPQYRLQFTPLATDCTCPVCNQGYTRAYFHHLFQHTPLLCQRLLILHNVHYCQNQLLKS